MIRGDRLTVLDLLSAWEVPLSEFGIVVAGVRGIKFDPAEEKGAIACSNPPLV